jgi:hypothetical protein
MIDLNVLTSWLLSAVVSMASQEVAYNSADVEDHAAKMLRLESISRDIVTVAFDPKEKPLFQGPRGREMTAVFIAATAAAESGGFLKSVDSGEKRGDHGRSWCIMQINIGKGKTPEGWTGSDLIKDRGKCIKTGYRVMKSSMSMCKGSVRDSLAAYLSGNCRVGIPSSRARYDRAMKAYAKIEPLNDYMKNLVISQGNGNQNASITAPKKKKKKLILL